MKKILYGFIIFFLFIVGISAKEVTINLFYSSSCPHCKAEKEFLNTINDDEVKIEMYEVSSNKENSDLLDLVKESLDCSNNYVPYTVIGDIGLTGYSDNIRSQILHFIEKYKKEDYIDVVSKVKENGKSINLNKTKEEKEEQYNQVTIPLLGEVDTKKVSLPLIAIIIGFVDGFNPCAMWILIFLISMLIGMNNKKRMITLGLTFLTTSALVYMGIMLSWLEILKRIINESYMQYLIGIVAIGAAIWNLYSYYKSTKKETGCEVVNNNSRKKIINKIKKFTSEKSLILSLLGVITLAISVNFIEFACSAGWPIIFTNILEINNLTGIQSFIYILLYIIFFLIDDIIVFTIAMATLNIKGISNKYSKYSHLIGGILMLIIGILMIFAPNILMFNF